MITDLHKFKSLANKDKNIHNVKCMIMKETKTLN